ncbi:MAG: cytochrome C [Epsilonproteobacteria bacterium]|nr:cytochrome C [Campylobacterota bacterium]NPA63386.1 cytochrome C [Campylobacterota bacterium]
MKKSILLLAAISLFAADTIFQKLFSPKEPTLYQKECGSCHFAYQPQLLPKRSWQKMMANLEDHFGTDATLGPSDNKTIAAYLYANAADVRPKGEMSEMALSMPKDKTLLRITELPKFKKEHRKIPQRYIEQKAVKSLSNCAACHRDAKRGLYEEENILIPGYGRWED